MSIAAKGAKSLTDVVADFAAIAKTGSAFIHNAYGYVAGTKVTTIDASGAVSIARTDIVGKSLGTDIVTKAGSIITTEYYDGAGKHSGTDRADYSAINTISNQHYDTTGRLIGAENVVRSSNGLSTSYHYDGSWNLQGVDTIGVGSDGSTTTIHYDERWNMVGAEQVVTSGNVVTTQFYNAEFAFQGAETMSTSDGGTSIEHYNAAWKMTGADLVKVTRGVTTTYHYDAEYALTGSEKTSIQGTGVAKTLIYDASYRQTGVDFLGTDRVDTLKGYTGTTHFHGGLGSDVLRGGTGTDFFHFDTAIGQGDVDMIQNFGAAKDKIVLDSSIFSALDGRVDTASFALGSVALTATQHILYDTATSNLYYDVDGVGGQAATLFAKFAADTALTAGSFTFG